MTLSEEAAKMLREWLDNREYCIADGEDDFGELRLVFKEVVGRDPSIYSP
jgi:hypothetical protein